MTDIRLLASIVATAAAVACASAPAPPATEAKPVPVALGQAAYVDLPASFEAGGIVRARATAAIASRVMAPVARVHAAAGDRVRRGAPLVTLDRREIDANNERAAAALTGSIEAERAAQAEVRAAEAGLRLARATHERMDTLHAKRAATTHELDQAVAGLRAAEAQLAGAQARAAAAAAARDAARFGRQAAGIGATYAVLTAPFDGVIAERSVDPGSMAVPGVPLLTIEDAAERRLEVTLDEARAAWIQVGRPADVRIGDAGDAWIAGRVIEVARINPASHSFLVKIAVPGAAAPRSGVFGRARFTGPPRRTLTVPAGAAFRRGQLTFVYTVGEDGLARLRSISGGDSSADRLEVLAGLRDGDRVVVNPPPSLSDGTRVAAGTDRAGGAR